ncbi:MAG: VanZ family protein [Planctomycetota bacterium]|nr:VanZ family protein [Planctomycetota bacterium]
MDGTQAERPRGDATGRDAAPGVRAFRTIGRALLRQPRIVSWVAPVVWASLIFYLSSFQPRTGPLNFEALGGLVSNLAHPAIFGVLALLIVPVLGRAPGEDGRRWTSMSPEAALWIVALVTLYGFTDELHQSTVEGRDASLLDVLSDFTGALSVVLVVRLLGRADATDRGLRRALLMALFASLTAAGLSTVWDKYVGEPLWPF